MSDLVRHSFDLFDVFLILFSGMLTGLVFGRRMSDASWRLTGDQEPRYRTPHCSVGKFYYVIPEREFVQLRQSNAANRTRCTHQHQHQQQEDAQTCPDLKD